LEARKPEGQEAGKNRSWGGGRRVEPIAVGGKKRGLRTEVKRKERRTQLLGGREAGSSKLMVFGQLKRKPRQSYFQILG